MRADLAALLEEPPPRAPLRLPLVVYGAGGKGRRTVRFLAAQGLKASAVLDANAQSGQSCEGIPVHAPAAWRRAHAPSEFDAVVAIHNPGVDMARLGRELREFGLRRVVQPVELHQLFGAALPQDFFLAPASLYRQHRADIARARELYADDASRRWYDCALEFRLGGDYGVLPPPSPADQYRPADLPRWRDPMRLVDCGAFDGDSLRMFLSSGYRLAAFAAFEADRANFQRLARSPGLPAETRLFPSAVGANAGTLRFAAGQGGASRLDETGDTVVDCVRLDDALAGFRPTLIKMDIEGAEHEALAGAAGLIAETRSGLAISAYHRPEDLWRLALRIDAWKLGYRLYLRGHAHSTFDLVLYGIPQ
jgi:FkbM family methyltransferase